MSRPKVAHVTTVAISLQALLLNQLRSIQDAGYEVVGISSPGTGVAAVEAIGVRHVAVPMTRRFTPGTDLLSLWRLYRVMRRERFAIVHTHTPKAGLLGQLAARMAGVPVVINTLHGLYFHEQTPALKRVCYIALEKAAARCSHLVLSQNREDVETVVRARICAPGEVRHLGNGIDLAAFDPGRQGAADRRSLQQSLALPAGAKVVGFVGRLAAARKGFLDFLRAAQEVAKHDGATYFLVVGEADHGKADAVEPSAAAAFGIWDRCRFLGQRPNSELPRLYALMDVLVLPSIFEGIPRVVMEASAMGVPTVATDVKGNREAVEAGRTGLLVPYGDVAALARSLLELLADGEKARRMGQEARRLALQRFDERRVFETVKAEYARLLVAKGLAVPEIGPPVEACAGPASSGSPAPAA